MELQKKKGFTLIELLIVVAIIAILSAIVLVAITNSRNKSKVANFKQQVKAIQTSAVLQCDTLTTTLPATLRGAIQAASPLPSLVSFSGTGAPTPQTETANCGPAATNTFVLNIMTTAVGTCNTATIRPTGADFLAGC